MDGLRFGIAVTMMGFGLVGCGATPVASDGGESGDGGEFDGQLQSVQVDVGRSIDLLFVIDNSASMGEAQAKLAQAIGGLVDRLDASAINYRIAVTTTDNGNPWCDGASPEAGQMRATSCLSRSSEFVLDGEAPVDARASACEASCVLDRLDILPTTTRLDPQPRPRPWLEGGAAGSNLGTGSVADALACMLPQGIDGCQFEQPLEAMYKALKRADFEGEPEYGFLRPAAVLGIIVVTDAVDCSHDPEQEEIFLPDSDRHLWSDPDADEPTAAVCWNAGVSCWGEGPSYDCDASHGGYLQDVDRYVALLQSLEDAATDELHQPRELLFAAIAGVGIDGEVIYHDASTEEAMVEHGIGPGCVSEDGEALPPVRLREVAEASALDPERPVLAPVCEPSFDRPLDRIADRLLERIAPACVTACVADVDAGQPGLQPYCEVATELRNADGSLSRTEVPRCEDTNEAALCWKPRTGEARSDACTADDWNLELALSSPVPSGARVYVDCVLSQNKARDCGQ